MRCINSAGGYQFFTPTAVETNKKYADFGAVIIEGVGHYPMLEKPVELNRKLRVVLKELCEPEVSPSHPVRGTAGSTSGPPEVPSSTLEDTRSSITKDPLQSAASLSTEKEMASTTKSGRDVPASGQSGAKASGGLPEV